MTPILPSRRKSTQVENVGVDLSSIHRERQIAGCEAVVVQGKPVVRIASKVSPLINGEDRAFGSLQLQPWRARGRRAARRAPTTVRERPPALRLSNNDSQSLGGADRNVPVSRSGRRDKCQLQSRGARLVSARPHKSQYVGSIPTPATNLTCSLTPVFSGIRATLLRDRGMATPPRNSAAGRWPRYRRTNFTVSGAALKVEAHSNSSLAQVGRPAWMSIAGDIMGGDPRYRQFRSVCTRGVAQYSMSLAGGTPAASPYRMRDMAAPLEALAGVTPGLPISNCRLAPAATPHTSDPNPVLWGVLFQERLFAW